MQGCHHHFNVEALITKDKTVSVQWQSHTRKSYEHDGSNSSMALATREMSSQKLRNLLKSIEI